MNRSQAAIPIGITARNEAKNILGFLASLNIAIARASRDLACTYSVHVLLNDNSDNTPELLADFTGITVWNTYGGIVEAQRALAEHCGETVPFLVFSDADILVEEDALLEVSRVMLDAPGLEIAYAEKSPLPPGRQTPLARALYLYNLREGYQTKRHYCNGQFFAIRRWRIPRSEQLRWNALSDTPFLNLAAGIRVDDIYLSREVLRRAGPQAIRCVPAHILYRPPETLRGMFRKYQRMRLELERLDHYFPAMQDAHTRWGRRGMDPGILAVAPFAEKLYHRLFQAALLLCRAAYRSQRWYFTHLSSKPCPTWFSVIESKERIS